MFRYRDSLAGPSNAKKRKLEEELGVWGVSDPNLCRKLASKIQEYQYQDLQEFIHCNREVSEAQNDGGPNVPEPVNEDLSVYLDLGNSTDSLYSNVFGNGNLADDESSVEGKGLGYSFAGIF
ncbi:hypothetical protein FBEOM_13647 [Fusarium beomiforme]|uniref:Uncharacterized protein n=1 Tax=Fusarium beomiforme TaxID=44412 RepID=A0A9P5DS84_9HYPO|nr:hypothetical protein FBEOM_13647 [Fusarium beomiforme]